MSNGTDGFWICFSLLRKNLSVRRVVTQSFLFYHFVLCIYTYLIDDSVAYVLIPSINLIQDWKEILRNSTVITRLALFVPGHYFKPFSRLMFSVPSNNSSKKSKTGAFWFSFLTYVVHYWCNYNRCWRIICRTHADRCLRCILQNYFWADAVPIKKAALKAIIDFLHSE
jgi:hypothetical protein